MAVSDSKSKTLNAYSYSGTFTLTAAFSEHTITAEDIANNRSRVDVSATLACGTGSFDVYNAGDLKIYWYDNNTNSSGYLAATLNISTLMSGNKSASATIQVPHKADGTVSGYAKAVWTQNRTDYGYYPASGNISTDNKALTAIDRYANFETQPTIADRTESYFDIFYKPDMNLVAAEYAIKKASESSYGQWVSLTPSTTAGDTFRINNLDPDTFYNVKMRIQGYSGGAWQESNVLSESTLNYIMILNVSGVWYDVIPYVKVNGVWKKTIPFMKINGSWKKGIH